jgi:hypothetical protein
LPGSLRGRGGREHRVQHGDGCSERERYPWRWTEVLDCGREKVGE